MKDDEVEKRAMADAVRDRYLSRLNEHHADSLEFFSGKETRYEYLSDYIFDYAVCDANAAERMVKAALAVCISISTQNTYEYIDDPEQYAEYLWVINTVFFTERVDWGVSIRGAFWSSKHGDGLIRLDYEMEGMPSTEFTIDDWKLFIEAMCLFINQS